MVGGQYQVIQLTKPYFEILQSTAAGTFSTVTVNGNTVRIAETFTKNVIQVPYGYVFTTTNAVVDFLVSYGQLLDSARINF